MQLKFPSWLSWYKKPEYRDIKEYATNISSGKRTLSPDGRNGGIPSRLRLERILANKTCSPMSLYDFYMYLKHIEYSEENLEFYIWFKNYEAAYAKGLTIDNKDYRFIPSASQSTSSVAHIKLGDSLTSLEQPESEDDEEDSAEAKETLDRISQMISTTALCASKSGTCAIPAPIHTTSPSKPSSKQSPSTPADPPLASEITTIINLFLLPSSPKELNIPPALRAQALADVRRSTSPTTGLPSPDALRPVAEHAYSLLRNCSHRNFVRLGVGNGTFETVCVATVLGAASLLAGFLLALCRALASPARGARSRWEAWAAWPLWWLGMSLVLSGLRGSCFFLLLFSRRQRLPWERFDDESGAGGEGGGAGGGGGEGKGEKNSGESGRLGDKGRRRRGGMSENRWLGAGGFSLVRSVKRLMIFDRRLKVQERHLRRLQRKIVLQSLAGGSVFATLCVALFIVLPVWRETV
ncbi:98e482b1-84ff-4bb2-8f16-50177fb54321 [Thermothielavioides terrestris]|uniref:98e482b1-84ff-4bb2-8f16-50177fb54321 n=1 Tax=Thermothielavioides terrestris TaxID=2587410 RepID=A0A3S4C8U0_9PEZI|nr:98e482b1-84ff-4bb2-8f16-50177fb54321 [Thermothielavioides terrestris]